MPTVHWKWLKPFMHLSPCTLGLFSLSTRQHVSRCFITPLFFELLQTRSNTWYSIYHAYMYMYTECVHVYVHVHVCLTIPRSQFKTVAVLSQKRYDKVDLSTGVTLMICHSWHMTTPVYQSVLSCDPPHGLGCSAVHASATKLEMLTTG